MDAVADLLPNLPVTPLFGDGSLTILAGVAIVLALLVVWAIVLPAGPLRLLVWLMSHAVWWTRRFGVGHIPASGAALLVCTPLSYLDWLLLWAAIPRPARIV